jgi:hypothetical protein
MANLAKLIEEKNTRRMLLNNQIRWVASPEGEPVEEVIEDQDEVSFVPSEPQEQQLKDSLNPWNL